MTGSVIQSRIDGHQVVPIGGGRYALEAEGREEGAAVAIGAPDAGGRPGGVGQGSRAVGEGLSSSGLVLLLAPSPPLMAKTRPSAIGIAGDTVDQVLVPATSAR